MRRLSSPRVRHYLLVAAVVLSGLALVPAARADAVTTSSSFSPASTTLGGASTLTITETATADATGAVEFSTEMYAPFGIGLTPSSFSACGGTMTVSVDSTFNVPFALGPGYDIELSGGSVSPGSPCMFTLPVTGDAAGTTSLVDQYDPAALIYVQRQAGLTVAPSEPAPQVAISLSPASIPVGGLSTETISLSNPSSAAMSYLSAIAVNGLLFTPFSLVSNTCGGQVAATGDSPAATQYDFQLRMAEGSLPPGGSCQLTATLNVSSFPAGTYPVNVTAASREGGTATDSVPLTVTAAPSSTTNPPPTGGTPPPALRASLKLGAGIADSGTADDRDGAALQPQQDRSRV